METFPMCCSNPAGRSSGNSSMASFKWSYVVSRPFSTDSRSFYSSLCRFYTFHSNQAGQARHDMTLHLTLCHLAGFYGALGLALPDFILILEFLVSRLV